MSLQVIITHCVHVHVFSRMVSRLTGTHVLSSVVTSALGEKWPFNLSVLCKLCQHAAEVAHEGLQWKWDHLGAFIFRIWKQRALGEEEVFCLHRVPTPVTLSFWYRDIESWREDCFQRHWFSITFMNLWYKSMSPTLRSHSESFILSRHYWRPV